MLTLTPLLLAAALSAQSQKQSDYLNLAAATLENPITHAELTSAVLSPDGVASIRALFDRSLGESLTFTGGRVTPELGGESMLTDAGELRLVVYPDPIHPVVRELVERRDEPPELLKYLESSIHGKFLLKSTGGLHALLYQMTGEPTDAQRDLLNEVIEQAVAQHFKTWTTDPSIQAEMIEQTDWQGRYAGFWHLHPPRLKGTRAAEGIEPSMADMKNAVELGQFITIVYQPEGFDVYNLSPLSRGGRPDLSKARVIRYRSQEWSKHFQSRFAVAP